MVLAQFKLIKDNSKFIIIGAMVLGALYPFFANAELPIVKDPKYLSIAALIAAMVLFWELYGEKKASSQQAFPGGYQSEFERFGRSPMPQNPIMSRQPVQQMPPRSHSPPRQQYQQYTTPPTLPISDYPSYQPSQYPQNIPQSKSTDPNITDMEQKMTDLRKQYAGGMFPQELMPENLVQESLQRKPNLLNVVRGVEKLPDKIPLPKDVPVKRQSNRGEASSFEQFGIR